MARPKKYTLRVNTAVRLDPKLHKQLTIAAQERELTINWMINRAIEEYLKRLIPVDEIKWTRD